MARMKSDRRITIDGFPTTLERMRHFTAVSLDRHDTGKTSLTRREANMARTIIALLNYIDRREGR